MNCSYLYEIHRKSEEISEGQDQQRSNLRTFSEEEEEIWEVPAESFENAYQQVENEMDEDDGSPKLSNNQATSLQRVTERDIRRNLERQKLRLSLSAEQIALKTQQQQDNSNKQMSQTIDKSINTEIDVTRPMTVNTNNTIAANITATTISSSSNSSSTSTTSSVKWKNIKINNPYTTNEKQKSLSLGIAKSTTNIAPPQAKETEVLIRNYSEIKLSPPPKRLTSKKVQNSLFGITSLEKKYESPRKFSLGSSPPPLLCKQQYADIREPSKCCPSPEYILDRILSVDSEEILPSSSLSFGILMDEGVATNVRSNNPFTFDNPNGGEEPKNTILEYELLSKDIKSPLQQNHPLHRHPCQQHQQVQNSKPSIIVTRPLSSSSVSTLNNAPRNSTSSETFETASSKSRNSPQLRNEMETEENSRTVEGPTQLPQILLCQICNDIFKDPRCLNCLHTFCLECIVEESFKQEVNSPFGAVLPPLQQQQHQQQSTNSPQIEQQLKVCNAPHQSRKNSTSPELKTDNKNSDLYGPPTISLQKRPSFSFKLRRSSEHSSSKTKLDIIKISPDNSLSSSSTPRTSNLARTIVCRICQFATDVPMGGLRQLPRNQLMVRKINEYRFQMTAELSGSCSLCYEETNATHFCETCTLNLCTLCKESHERQKCTANHNIKTIMEYKTDKMENNDHNRENNKLSLKCCLHMGFEIKSFCNTCLQVACSDCLVLQHKGHKVDPIDKAIKYYSTILSESTEQTRITCKSSEHALEKLNATSLSINRKCDELQAEIEDFMERYTEAVELHKTMLLQQIHRYREIKLEKIAEQHLELEKRTHEGQMAIGFSQELMGIASDVEQLSFIKILLKRFEYCQQFKASLDPKIMNIPNFLPKIQAPITKDSNDIPVFGIITVQTVEPSSCTLQWDGFSQLRLNKKVELTLISRDADGLPMCHGGLKIQTHVKYKDLNSKCLRMEVCDNSDGTYSIAFTPDSEGTIILMITINEKHIKGSPFSFLARSVRPHTGIYHCCTFCSSKGNKFATCSCEGNMPGYSGCGHGHAGHPGRRHWSCCGEILRNSECYFANRSLNPK